MRRQPLVFAAQLLLIGLVAATSWASPDDRRDAQRAFRKNARRLAGYSEQLAEFEERLRTDQRLMGREREQVEEGVGELRVRSLELIQEVRAADDEDAAEFLVQYGTSVGDQELYEQTERELGRMEHDDSIEWLAETLEEIDEGGGRRRRRRGGAGWESRVLIARAFRDIFHERVNEALATVIENGTKPQVVNTCVEAARDKQDPQIVSALIALLGRVEEQGGWEYHRVRDALTSLTGEDFFTQERWSAWWEPKQDDYDFSDKGEAVEAATRQRGPEEEIPSFYGSEIESNRVIFILDTSGSMEMTDRPNDHPLDEDAFEAANPDSPDLKPLQRIERAKAALIAAVENLTDTQSFNIIPFSSSPRQWQDGLVPATEANKRQAIEFVENFRADGGTATYDALERAFADPNVDTIYLLSDGAPSGNKIGNPGEQAREFAREEVNRILDFVRQQNRFRNIVINTFGMDGPGSWHRKWGPRPVTLPTEPEWLSILSSFMRDLASMTGGEYESI